MKVFENQSVDATTGKIKQVNEVVTDFRGEKATLIGFEAPQNSNSSGRVYVNKNGQTRSCYPGVFGLKIIQIEKEL